MQKLQRGSVNRFTPNVHVSNAKKDKPVNLCSASMTDVIELLYDKTSAAVIDVDV